MSTSRWNLLPPMTLSGLPAASAQPGLPGFCVLAQQFIEESQPVDEPVPRISPKLVPEEALDELLEELAEDVPETEFVWANPRV